MLLFLLLVFLSNLSKQLCYLSFLLRLAFALLILLTLLALRLLLTTFKHAC